MQNTIISHFSIQSPLPLFSFLFGVLFCLKIFLTISMASKEAWQISLSLSLSLYIYIYNSTATVTNNSLKCLHRGTRPFRNPSAPSNVSSCRWRWGPVGPARTGCGHLHCPARSLPPGGQTQSEADLWKWSILFILKPPVSSESVLQENEHVNRRENVPRTGQKKVQQCPHVWKVHQNAFLSHAGMINLVP